MDQRIGLIVACREGEESMAALCRHFGISRKTGHKGWARYRAEGAARLGDRPRAPHRNPRALADDVTEALLAVRQRHPGWGPRKVKAWLEERRVGHCGAIKRRGEEVFVNQPLCGEPAGLFAIARHVWLVQYGPNRSGC